MSADDLKFLLDRLQDPPTNVDGEVVGQANEFAWREARCGRFTASKFADLIGNTDTGLAYIIHKAVERITGVVEVVQFTTDAMTRGIEMESEAFEWLTEHWTDTLEGAAIVKRGANLAATPDFYAFKGDVPGDIKCPGIVPYVQFMTLHHDDTGMALKKWNKAYYWQIKVQAYCCQKDYCALAYYHPQFDPRYRHTVRTYRLTSDDKQTIENTLERSESMLLNIVDQIIESKRIA